MQYVHVDRLFCFSDGGVDHLLFFFQNRATSYKIYAPVYRSKILIYAAFSPETASALASIENLKKV